MQTLMNVQTRASVPMNSVRILLDPMNVYPANQDTKHREECVTVRIHTHINTHECVTVRIHTHINTHATMHEQFSLHAFTETYV